LSPRWKAKERRPFLETSCFLKEAGAAVLVLSDEEPVLVVDFFFDDGADFFLAVFLEDFVVIVIAPFAPLRF
jgi:hypothetical protein